jgi:hypothetical protein
MACADDGSDYDEVEIEQLMVLHFFYFVRQVNRDSHSGALARIVPSGGMTGYVPSAISCGSKD